MKIKSTLKAGELRLPPNPLTAPRDAASGQG
jgi:hypothetical protein